MQSCCDYSKVAYCMRKLLSMKGLWTWTVALLALIGIFTSSSFLSVNTSFPDCSDDNVCSVCAFLHSKREKTGNNVPTSNTHVCFSHGHCHNPPAITNTVFLLNSGDSHQFWPLEDLFVPVQLTASIFHPPQDSYLSLF